MASSTVSSNLALERVLHLLHGVGDAEEFLAVHLARALR